MVSWDICDQFREKLQISVSIYITIVYSLSKVEKKERVFGDRCGGSRDIAYVVKELSTIDESNDRFLDTDKVVLAGVERDISVLVS